MRSRALRISEPPKWRLLVRLATRDMAPFDTPVNIEMVFHGGTPGRPLDPDNHPKCIGDGLVKAGIIKDDRWPYLRRLGLSAPPLAKGGRPWTLVEIEAVG